MIVIISQKGKYITIINNISCFRNNKNFGYHGRSSVEPEPVPGINGSLNPAHSRAASTVASM